MHQALRLNWDAVSMDFICFLLLEVDLGVILQISQGVMILGIIGFGTYLLLLMQQLVHFNKDFRKVTQYMQLCQR